MNNQPNPFEDFGFNFNKEDEQWDELINHINEGSVIPVIGPDLLVEPTDGRNYHQILIDDLAKWGHVKSKPRTFSQLVYDKDFLSELNKFNFKEEGIYLFLERLIRLRADRNVKVVLHPALLRLLETKRFPFVITTSFTSIVEDCMRQVWGDVKVLQFNNDPKRSSEIGFGDVKNEKELEKPTVFYMFGKLSKEPHRYAVTDMDFMEFCKSWMTGAGVPRNLAECLKKRYLLFLGGSYNDWLFRFIWFSMRHKPSGIQKDNTSMFVVKSKQTKKECEQCEHRPKDEEDSFERFLARIDAFIQFDPEKVIGEIESRLEKIDEENRKSEENYQWDVFISYSRSDSKTAESLYQYLVEKDLKVWFDTESIGDAEKWREKIAQGIKQSRLFVPLLTRNVEKECLDDHEYRIEWSEAAERAKRMGGRPYIIPVAEMDFDFYDTNTSVPNKFTELNATRFANLEDLSKVAEVIEEKLNELKALKKKLSNGR